MVHSEDQCHQCSTETEPWAPAGVPQGSPEMVPVGAEDGTVQAGAEVPPEGAWIEEVAHQRRTAPEAAGWPSAAEECQWQIGVRLWAAAGWPS